MKVKEPGLQFYADKISKGERFSFARYGNGEWDCILKLFHKTRSGSQGFSKDLRRALAASISVKHSGTYYHAMNPGFMERCRILPKAESWLARNATPLDWHKCTVFCNAGMKGRLFPLVKAMKQHHVVVVGPKWLKALPFANEFVPVRSRNCWQDANAIVAQLRNLKNVVISFSAGPAAKVLIHRLHPIIGEHSWLIDLGSLWDPYCGVKSRRYHGRITPAVQRKNLTGK